MERQQLQVGISYSDILRISLPISFAILIPQLNFFINTIFLGSLGETELGLAGITGVYYLIYSAMGIGLNNGLQVLIARRAGQNLPDEIGKLFAQGVRLVLVLSLLAILITYTILPFILKQSLPDGEKTARAISFLHIRIWGLPFLFLFQMCNALLVGTNRSRYLPLGSAAGTLLNVVLDYCLIFGALGLPRLGFNGAAWASVFAEFISMGVMLLVIRSAARGMGLGIGAGFDRQRTRLILVQSAPLMFQHAISIISWWFFFLLVGRMPDNTRTLAISQTMRNVFGLFSIFTWALGSTTNAMVSNIIGQERKDQVMKLTGRIALVSLGVAMCSCLVLNLFPNAIFSLFNAQDSFVHDAVPVIRVVSAALLIMSVSVVCLNAVVGTGSSNFALAIETVAIVLYSVYVYLVMEVFQLSVTIGWMSEWLYWTTLLLLSYGYLRTGRWKKRKI
ncbi:MAG: MATE family efflux transporter [Dinghuibacter sp.]|nr:MATE family efflux transporter [Dinghuibacter sp.]